LVKHNDYLNIYVIKDVLGGKEHKKTMIGHHRPPNIICEYTLRSEWLLWWSQPNISPPTPATEKKVNRY